MKSSLLLAVIAGAAHAQAPIPERTFGAPTAMGSEPLRSVAAVRELSDGRVVIAQSGPLPAMMQAMMANAMKAAAAAAGRGPADTGFVQKEQPSARLVIYDAGLKRITQIGQAGTGQLEYQQPYALLAGLGDTTLLIELTRSEMLVIDPNGKIVAAKQSPGGIGAQLAGGGIDRNGRLIYEPRVTSTRQTPAGMETGAPDTAVIMAFDFKIGSTVPLANVKVAGTMALMISDPSTGTMKMRTKANPFPTIDDWVVLPDGTLAIVRGADLHIDLIAPDGKRRSTPSITHTRVAVADSDKVKFLSAAHKSDSLVATMPMMPRGMTMEHLDPDSFPQFKPPFGAKGARAASDGTIWLPAHVVSPGATDGWAVVGTDGKVREIVHFAKGVRMVGFGKGVVYVIINDGRLGRIPLK